MIKNFNFLFVTFFGLGTFRYAPGTITSLVTTILLFSFYHILNFSSNLILLIFIIIFTYAFYAVSDYIKNNENKDPNEIVIDEVIGQFIPIYLYEISHGIQKDPQESFFYYILIFILFRFFDIKKPFPIYIFDKNFKNSFGVIFDDILAGLYVVLSLIIFMVLKINFLT